MPGQGNIRSIGILEDRSTNKSRCALSDVEEVQLLGVAWISNHTASHRYIPSQRTMGKSVRFRERSALNFHCRCSRLNGTSLMSSDCQFLYEIASTERARFGRAPYASHDVLLIDPRMVL